jgi:hypothetical protein
MNKIRAVIHRSPEVNVLCGSFEKIILSFEIYHPKNNVHNQDGNHDDNKVPITKIFFELTDNDGQNFLAGIVQWPAKKISHHFCVTSKSKCVINAFLTLTFK